jgi:hypothetical protein
MLYATVRSCAETAAAYRRISSADAADWLATATLLPGLAARYPLSAALPPVADDWREAPRAGLMAAVGLLASGLRDCL